MKKLKWGIVGTGNIAHNFAHDLTFSKHGVLGAVASRNIETALTFAKKYHCERAYGTYEALYEDEQVDAIYIATPHNFHFKNASDALIAGKPVLCEKPLSVNVQECKELIQIATSNRQYLMEGMWTYFLPAIIQAQTWINAGKIGHVTQVKADFGFSVPFNATSRLFNPDLAGGAMLDIGIYLLAFNWMVFQNDPKKIAVIGRKAPSGVDQDVTIMMEYTDATSLLSCSFKGQLPNYAYVVGTNGYIAIPNFWMAKEALLYKKEKLVDHFKSSRNSFGFNYQIDAVSQDILGGKKQSEVVSHAVSLKLQEQIQLVLKQI